MTGQRVIRDSEWRGHYSSSPLPANNCNYPNSTLTTIDLSPFSSPSSPSHGDGGVTAESVALSTRVVHTCSRACGEQRWGLGQICDSRKTQILVQLWRFPHGVCVHVCILVFSHLVWRTRPQLGHTLVLIQLVKKKQRLSRFMFNYYF